MTVESPDVFIADVDEAGPFRGRAGWVFGWTQPSASGEGPVIGAGEGWDEDFAWSVYFPDTEEQVWFAPHLVKHIKR